MTKRRIACSSVVFLFLSGAVLGMPAPGSRADPAGLGSTAPASAVHSAQSTMDLTDSAGVVTHETRGLTDKEAALIVGGGWRSDFWCGVAAGAGLVLSATGVLTPVGVGLSAGGIYCALYL